MPAAPPTGSSLFLSDGDEVRLSPTAHRALPFCAEPRDRAVPAAREEDAAGMSLREREVKAIMDREPRGLLN